MKRLLALTSLLVLVSCGSGSHGPIDPTPTPTTRTLSFTSESGTPAPRSFALVDANERIANEVAVNIVANDFSGAAFSMFRGTLVFDPSVITLLDYTEGAFMKQ